VDPGLARSGEDGGADQVASTAKILGVGRRASCSRKRTLEDGAHLSRVGRTIEQRDGEAVGFRAAEPEPGGQGRGRLDRLLLRLLHGGRRAGVGRALDEAVLALGQEPLKRRLPGDGQVVAGCEAHDLGRLLRREVLEHHHHATVEDGERRRRDGGGPSRRPAPAACRCRRPRRASGSGSWWSGRPEVEGGSGC
jgi:hypothetical protein